MNTTTSITRNHIPNNSPNINQSRSTRSTRFLEQRSDWHLFTNNQGIHHCYYQPQVQQPTRTNMRTGFNSSIEECGESSGESAGSGVSGGCGGGVSGRSGISGPSDSGAANSGDNLQSDKESDRLHLFSLLNDNRLCSRLHYSLVTG